MGGPVKKSTLYKLLLTIRDYVNKFKKTDASFETVIRNESFFREKFTQFLFSPKGASFQVIIVIVIVGMIILIMMVMALIVVLMMII